MRPTRTTEFRFASAIAIAMAITTPALAQADNAASAPSEGNANQLEEIVVTAQKRAQNLQEVPLSVTAVGAEALAARGITNVVDLGNSVPGLQIQEFSGLLLPFLRGVGSSGNSISVEASVALYLDGVFYARLPSTFFDLRNVERVEVLKGPQGTLFGRNSTGGVINIVTRDPQYETKIMGSAGYGRFDAIHGDVYMTTGLSDKVAMDLSVSAKTDDGFGKNLATGGRYGYEDSVLVRSKLMFEATDRTKILLSGFYQKSKQSGQKAAFPGTGTGTVSQPNEVFRSEEFGYYNSVSDFGTDHKYEGYGGTLRVEQDLDVARLTSISAWSHFGEIDRFDGDYGPRADFAVPIEGRVNLFTQELQLTNAAGSPLEWIVGLYYYNNSSKYTDVRFLAPLLFGPGISAPAQQKATSYAAFAQATYEILPRLKLTGGIRYTRDTTKASAIELALLTDPKTQLPVPPPGKAKVNKVTFKAALDYQATDDVLLYASFSRGYRSGIFNLLTYNTDVPTKPEGLDAYEVGIKSDLFDRRVRINAAAFYYDISNPQVQLIRNGTVFFSNAGSSRVKGAEIEAQALIFEGFTTRASATYLDSKYKSYIDAPFSIPDQVNGGAIGLLNGDARGNRTPLAAKFVFNLGADYTVPLAGGELTVTADYYHNSGYYYEPDNFLYQPSYELLNGQIKFAPTENYAIRVWGKNLTGEKYTIAAATQVGQSGYPWTPAKPRTYGIAVDFNF